MLFHHQVAQSPGIVDSTGSLTFPITPGNNTQILYQHK